MEYRHSFAKRYDALTEGPAYSRHNPRKMVRVWAEKEMRNLKRLRAAGIRCPEPIEVRENVLVMTFVGDKEGWLVAPL